VKELEEMMNRSTERWSTVTTEFTTRRTGAAGRPRGAVLLSLALGAVLAAMVALVAGAAREAEAASPEKIVFVSNRTTGKGVENPTGDREVFTMNPNGTGVKQLTFNEVVEYEPTLSPDGKKVAYTSRNAQTSNPEGDQEVYIVNAPDGSGQKNLTDNGVNDDSPEWGR
jgi:Tol biopolymer transport system component